MASKRDAIADTTTDSSMENPSLAVVRAVAEASGEDPTEMEPLYRAIDPDALDALCSSPEWSPSNEVAVTFPYNGYVVEVSGDGDVSVTSRD